MFALKLFPCQRKAWPGLESKLQETVSQAAMLMTVITRDVATDKITVYGKRIRESHIFRTLNMSTGQTIRWRSRNNFKGCQGGFFIQSSNFETGECDNHWVAVIGIDNQPEECVQWFKF